MYVNLLVIIYSTKSGMVDILILPTINWDGFKLTLENTFNEYITEVVVASSLEYSYNYLIAW